MAWRDWGSTPINSHGGTSTGYGIETNPSSATLIAEIDSTQLANVLKGGSLHQVTWVLGASTNATWMVEQASSTSLSTSAIRDRTYIQTPSNQSGQYILTYKLEKGDRLRARIEGGVTGVATAKISAEPLT